MASVVLVKDQVLLPLIPESEDKEPDAHNSVTMALMSNPVDDASPKCKVTQRVLEGQESIRTLIAWRQMTLTVLTGLNLTQNDHCAQAVAIIRGFLKGRCLSLFDDHLVICQRKEMERQARVAFENTDGNEDAKNAAAQQVIARGVAHDDH